VVIALPARPLAGPGAAGGGGPPLIGRDAARELARRELSKPAYHHGVPFLQRILGKIVSFLRTVFQHANTTVPGGWWAIVILAALVVIILGVILTRLGPVALGHRDRSRRILAAHAMTAREHRELAQHLAAERDWAGAIREILRAIAVDLEERAILPPRAGRTADELAAEAGSVLPGCADELRSAARLFDDVWYGERPGTREGYAMLRRLDAAVGAARPAPLEPAGAGGSTA
jgi:Domain of unknown function (DUF4129)